MICPRIPTLALTLIASVSIASGCGRAPATHDSVVRVNGRPLTTSEFNRFVHVKLGEFAAEPLDDAVRSELLDEFVKREVTAQAARARGLEPINGIPEAAMPGDEEVCEEQATDMLVEKFYVDVVKEVTVSPEEVSSYYAKNRSAYCPVEGYYVREIRAASRDAAERARREIVAGKAVRPPDVTEVTSQVYTPSALPAGFRSAVKPLADGQASQVVRSNFGYHVFVREPYEEVSGPPAPVRERIASDLRATKNERIVNDAVEKLVRSAKVEIDPNRLSFHYEGRFASRN
jgi:hypothetical protein